MIFLEPLNELCESATLVDVRRDDLEVDDLRGFIVATSPKLVLMSLVADDISHDGFVVIDLDHVTFLRWGTGQMNAWQDLLATMPRPDLKSEINLSDWAGALEMARLNSGVVAFHRERISSSTCYISDGFEDSESIIVGQQINIEGERDGTFALKVDDLTRLDFGGRYESGLFRLLQRG